MAKAKQTLPDDQANLLFRICSGMFDRDELCIAVFDKMKPNLHAGGVSPSQDMYDRIGRCLNEFVAAGLISFDNDAGQYGVDLSYREMMAELCSVKPAIAVVFFPLCKEGAMVDRTITVKETVEVKEQPSGSPPALPNANVTPDQETDVALFKICFLMKPAIIPPSMLGRIFRIIREDQGSAAVERLFERMEQADAPGIGVARIILKKHRLPPYSKGEPREKVLFNGK